MSIKHKLKIAVIGATGYTGLDLVYILSKHPKVKIVNLCATKNLNKNISFFDKRIKKKLPKTSSINKINWNDLDLVFLSLPNGEYIDLSADFRIANPKQYYKTYNIKHNAKELIKKSIYSISEFNKFNIQNYRIISNPGCYPTSIQLALNPLLKKKLINIKDITIDSKSGYSGAGKGLKNKFKHKNLFNSTFAYNVKNHRHMSEIDQEFYKITKNKVNYTFNPYLLPTFRGILSSIYVNTKGKIKAEKIRNELKRFYKKSKFIKILKLNSELGSGDVLNTNNCEISVCETRVKNKLIIFSAIDNLVKGASGQAVQNMNLLYKFSETLGLK